MVDALMTVDAEGIHKKVILIAANEIAISWGYKKRLDTLEHTLKIICAKLRDTENEKGQSHGVMVWLALLKHVVSEADDLLDDVHYEMLRHEVVARDHTRMISFDSLPSLKMFLFHRETGQRIENLTNKFCEMNEQANILALQNRHPCLVPDGFHQESDSYVDEFKIVRRENDELHIIQLLTQMRKEERVKIVSIMGMGGIGKTALAKVVYQNLKILQHFHVRVWLCVSIKVDVNTLLAKICESLPENECKAQTRVDLITNLQHKLGSRRYLVVLDDVWDGEKGHWDDLRSCMLNVNSLNGSYFLVTTRIPEIGTKAEDFHALKRLSDDECWFIFKETVFVPGQSLLPELEDIGRDIVNKCHGLPLLIKVLGGMLRNYNDKEKWLSIKDNKAWDLEEEGHIIQNILKLCFDNLPSSLVKRCFTYCSIFEKNTVMNKEELIQLWMALGLVLSDTGAKKEMEDIGNDIFHVLVGSSLFQDVKRNVLTSCGMHDLVHDLSSSLSKHESLCLMHRENRDIVQIPQVKHLAVYQDLKKRYELNTKVSMALKEGITTRALHTLFFEGEVEKNISFQHFKFTRILKFSNCKLEKLDDSIGELVYLRFLDLSNTQIKVLPKSIGKLYQLQTLNLLGCYHLQQLPIEIKNLISLRFFEFPKLFIVHMVGQLTSLRTLPFFGVHKQKGYQIEELGHLLQQLPIEIKNLISLRFFEFPKLFIVHMVGQLTSLRTLPFFGVHKQKGYQIEELGHLKHLRGELHIFNLEDINNKDDALKACLSEKKNLHKIEFVWSRDRGANRNVEDVLEGLQPHGNVTSLTIINFSGDNFPPWVMKMSLNIEGRWEPFHNLLEIILCGCKSCLYLPMLEYLPLLQDLVLEYMDNVKYLRSSSDHGDNATRLMKPLSPSLRSLKLYGMQKLEKWTYTTTNSSTMISPVLQRLQIHNCPKIILLYERHLHPLVSLEIHNCDNLMSIKSIHGLTSLESLEIHNCPSLLGIPDLPIQGNSLKKLNITYCFKLSSLSREMFDCFAFLNKLSLGRFSNELHAFPSLQGIDKLKNHLCSLELFGWNHWESIPEEIKHLSSLTRFLVFSFGMRELPSWLTYMSYIRDMRFYDCHMLNKGTVKLRAPHEADHVFLNGKRV